MGAIESIECCSTRDRNGETPRSVTARSARSARSVVSEATPRCIPVQERSVRKATATGNSKSRNAVDAENAENDENAHGGVIVAKATQAVLGSSTRILGDKTNIQECPQGLEKHEKLPSMGSAQHAAGQCKRCCFYPRNRCTNGYDCEFCHYEHEKRSHRKRKSKSGRGRTDIDVDLDDDEKSDLEIQLPLTPESAAGVTGSWSTTPEGAAVFVQSCLLTVPLLTQDNTSTVPVYTPTLWGENQKPTFWASQGGDYTGLDGEGYQIPRDWQQYPLVAPREGRLLAPLPDRGSVIIPETAPLTVHEWQDMGCGQEMVWQEAGWSQVQSVVQAPEWHFSTGSEQQAWEWGMQPEENYLASWNGCHLMDDQAMCWNPQQITSHMVDTHMADYLVTAGESESSSDSQMPAYMPAIQNVPTGMVHAEDLVASARSTLLSTSEKAPGSPLPPGVEVAVDVEPPPLSPDAPLAP